MGVQLVNFGWICPGSAFHQFGYLLAELSEFFLEGRNLFGMDGKGECAELALCDRLIVQGCLRLFQHLLVVGPNEAAGVLGWRGDIVFRLLDAPGRLF